jgi:pyruvate/2-oxoglutarate dehydrogenase complex dihydrolipoamide acyltransferase (E2) component
MARRDLVMPQAGQDLESGTVLEWYKQVGDPVRKGEAVVLVETEKISLDVESPIDGYLREIMVPAGSEAAILAVIGVVATEDEPAA